MPRKPRKKIVGKAEDIERRERERKLAKLEQELHDEYEREHGGEDTTDKNNEG